MEKMKKMQILYITKTKEIENKKLLKKYQNLNSIIKKNNYNSNLYMKNLYQLQQNNDFLSEKLLNIETKNKSLINEIQNQRIEINYKNQMINTLKVNINQLEDEKYQIKARNNLDKNELIKENNKYRKFIMISQEKVKNIEKSYFIKLNEFNRQLTEKDNKIISLKNRVNELFYMSKEKNSNINLKRNKGMNMNDNNYENNFIPTEYSNNNGNYFEGGFQSSSQFYPKNNIKGIDINLINNNYKICHLKDNISKKK